MPDLTIMILILCFSGVVAGFIGGLIGLGGGGIYIPLFLIILPTLHVPPELSMHIAVATSLALIVPTNLSAAYKHFQLNNVSLNEIKSWVPFVLLGGLVASFVFDMISTNILKIIFILYLLACVFYMSAQKHNKPKNKMSHEDIPKLALMKRLTGGSITGFIASLLGISGSSFSTPYLLHNQYPIHRAIAISTTASIFVGIFCSVLAMYIVPLLV